MYQNIPLQKWSILISPGMTHCNAHAARQKYQARNPKRVSYAQTFINFHTRLCDNRNFTRKPDILGRPVIIQKVQNVRNQILVPKSKPLHSDVYMNFLP